APDIHTSASQLGIQLLSSGASDNATHFLGDLSLPDTMAGLAVPQFHAGASQTGAQVPAPGVSDNAPHFVGNSTLSQSHLGLASGGPAHTAHPLGFDLLA